jgi:hypothetical protein
MRSDSGGVVANVVVVVGRVDVVDVEEVVVVVSRLIVDVGPFDAPDEVARSGISTAALTTAPAPSTRTSRRRREPGGETFIPHYFTGSQIELRSRPTQSVQRAKDPASM